jgi:NAD(P)-dependent dehydrogenase (short-subunit alcohol dehydrogenase family)
VIVVGRNPERSAQALAELREAAANARVDMVVADMAEMAQARRAAAEIAALTDRIDALLNNAGGIGKERVVTAEGNEAVFAGNHLGPFLLTRELLPLLRRAAQTAARGSVRVINVSSLATDLSPGIDFDNLQMLADHEPNRAYCNVKIANQMFTRALAKRLEGDGIAVHAMHPGVVDTNFSSYASEATRKAGESMRHLAVSAEQGADTLVWLATEAELPDRTGGYYHNREPVPLHAQALDEAAVERLWQESEEIVARSLAERTT